MKKRVLSMFLSLVMVIGLMSVVPEVTIIKAKASSQADALVSVAKSQLGVKERSNGSDDIIYNDWYYGRRVSNATSGQYAWCAVFVSWCANQAGIPTSIIPKTAGTTNMKDLLLKNGGTAHLRNSGYSPVHGDIIFFGSNASTHVGIVDYTSGNTIYYIDGNNTQTSPHGVHYSSRTFDRTDVWGFVTPNYASTNPPSNLSITTDKNCYKVGETITFSFTSKDATELYIPIDVNGVREHFINVSGKTSYSCSFSKPGWYGFWLYAKNSSGESSTVAEYKNIRVDNTAPSDFSISVDKSCYKIGETVKFEFTNSNAGELYIPIDVNGKREHFINVLYKKSYSRSFTTPGLYYYSLYGKNACGDCGSGYFPFVVYDPTHLDIGTNVNCFIMSASWNPLMVNEDNNIVLGTENKTNMNKILWRFEKNDADNSYTIYNYYNNKILSVQDESTPESSALRLVDSSNKNKNGTKWWILKRADGMWYLKSTYSDFVITMKNRDTATFGTPAQINTMNESKSQQFQLYALDSTRDKISYSIEASNYSANVNTNVDITVLHATYSISYKFHIIDPSGKETIVDNGCNNIYSFKGAKIGKYIIYAEVESPVSKDIGSKTEKCVTIDVSCSHSYTTKVVAPTTTSQGYTLHTCSVCGDEYRDNYTEIKQLDGKLYYQERSSDRAIRFVAEVSVDDVKNANRSNVKVTVNGVSVDLPVRTAYKSIIANEKTVVAKEGYCFIVTSAIYAYHDSSEFILGELTLDNCVGSIKYTIK